jgi:hypothetical protein
MKKETNVEIFVEESNFVVLRVPSRRYPGVLIQGDSLVNLVSAAKDAIELFDIDKKEALEALKFLYDELNWRLEGYIKTLEANN